MKGVFFVALAALAIPGLCRNAHENEESHVVPIESSPTHGSAYEVVCDRRGQPPLQHHVYEAADKIKANEEEEKSQRCVTNHKGGCTKIEEGEGARISVCWGSGGVREILRGINCAELAQMARMVAEKCVKEERAGGRVYHVNTFEGEPRGNVGGYAEISRKQ